MFDKQYRFYGKHAKMVNDLTAVFEESAKTKLFERNLDVYINAPLVGYLYNRKGVKETGKDAEVSPQSIFPEQLINSTDTLQHELRTILILDKEYEPDEEKRLDKAFRFFGRDENDLALFDSYVLGGVEVLHEKLIQGASGQDDYVNRLYEFLEEIQERFNEDITADSILALCVKTEG